MSPQLPVGICTSEPHQIECDVQRRLLNDLELTIHSLVVHRLVDGVCIEGVVEGGTPLEEITRAVESVSGVERVMNRLVQRSPSLKG